MKKTNPSEPKPKTREAQRAHTLITWLCCSWQHPKTSENFFVPKRPCSFSIIPSTKKIQSSKQHIPTYKQVESKQKETQRREKKNQIHIHKTKLHSSPTFNRKKLDFQGAKPFLFSKTLCNKCQEVLECFFLFFFFFTAAAPDAVEIRILCLQLWGRREGKT